LSDEPKNEPALTPAQKRLLKRAEEKIQTVLHELEDATRLYVDSVYVDPRNWAQLKTEIFLTRQIRH